MGEHCEKMVQEWEISRAAQDALALKSHLNATAAYAEGFYDDLVFTYQDLDADTIPRKDTSLDKLAKLKPAFEFTGKGTLTAGNSSPLTDGSSKLRHLAPHGKSPTLAPFFHNALPWKVLCVVPLW